MSNSTRQGGYDERLVVPLEASRRGAHRARTNPLVAALPLLAVVAVVAAVIGVAYALFLRPGGDTTASDPLGSASSPAATGGGPSQSSSQPGNSQSPSKSASGSSSPTASAAAVNKAASISVYNGTGITGLAKRAAAALNAASFPKAKSAGNWGGAKVTTTTVFYAKESQAATAKAVATALKVGKPEQSSSAGNGIVVVTAADLDPVIP